MIFIIAFSTFRYRCINEKSIWLITDRSVFFWNNYGKYFLVNYYNITIAELAILVVML